jgi:hypothetical protein
LRVTSPDQVKFVAFGAAPAAPSNVSSTKTVDAAKTVKGQTKVSASKEWRGALERSRSDFVMSVATPAETVTLSRA